MQLIRGLHNIREQHKGSVLTIGNFDGVHLGHQTVLKHVVQQAKERNTSSIVMIFEPQPLELFRPEQAPVRLTQWREKYELISELGVDYLLCVSFTHRLAGLPATDFVERVLYQQLQIQHLVVGDDFRFGKNRQGDFVFLEQAGLRLGFGVTNTASYRQASTRVSSTLIREALSRHQFQEVEAMLGRPFYFSGRVRHGEKNGRLLGFPTANLPLHRVHSPLHGVFAVRVKTGEQAKRQNNTQQEWQGMANIGRRPTFAGQVLQLEVHLFDFSGDLYGKRLYVYPEYAIREEQKFASIDALRKQLEKDAKEGQVWFDKQS